MSDEWNMLMDVMAIMHLAYEDTEMIKVTYTATPNDKPTYGKGVKMFSGRGLAKTHRTCYEGQRIAEGGKVGKVQRKQK